MENEKSFWRKTLDIALNMINILKKSNAFKAYWKFTITKNRKANEKGFVPYIYWQAAKKDGLEIKNHADSLY